MKYAYEAESLLKKLISIKSFSFYEDKTADYIENIFQKSMMFIKSTKNSQLIEID